MRLTAETLAVSLPDTKREEALALLAENPEATHAITSDELSDPDNVLVHLAIRDEATCTLKVPRDRYDGLAILEMLNHPTEVNT